MSRLLLITILFNYLTATSLLGVGSLLETILDLLARLALVLPIILLFLFLSLYLVFRSRAVVASSLNLGLSLASSSLDLLLLLEVSSSSLIVGSSLILGSSLIRSCLLGDLDLFLGGLETPRSSILRLLINRLLVAFF